MKAVAVEREHFETGTDADRLKEAGVVDALIECLQDSGYGQVEYAGRVQLLVSETRTAFESRKDESSNPYEVATRHRTAIRVAFNQIKPSSFRQTGHHALFTLQDPYPEDYTRKPFWMLVDRESTGGIVEPEKKPLHGVVSSTVPGDQLELVRELEAARQAELAR